VGLFLNEQAVVAGPDADGPLVGCVLLNWNGGRDTVACLEALERCSYRRLEVVVVDNCSTDDSVEFIRARYPEITLLQAEANRGFATGNNLGVRWTLARGAQYVWLLNNDTAPAPDALTRMVEMAERDKRIGGVGSVLHYMHQPEAVQAWGGGRINCWFGYVDHAHEPHPYAWFDYLTAASMLVRRETLQAVGLLDEAFFLYWEDAEFGFRVRRGGWKLAVCRESIVLHKEGGSTVRNYALLDRYYTCAGLRFLSLHAPMPTLSAVLFAGMRLLRRLLRGEWTRMRAVMRGIGDYRRRSSGRGAA
jgi:GT2 family glycosyltransferase